jgi:hypothetical protein
VTDVVRASLDEAERLLDEGDYTGSVRASAEAWAALATAHPEVVVAPPTWDSELPLEGRGPPPQRGRGPDAQGVTVTLAEGAAPEIVLNKSRYTMSDAITYYEYALDALKLVERSS